MSTTRTCTTCGRPADRPYENDLAQERCHDPIHTALCNCNKLGNVTHTMGIAGCAYGETPAEELGRLRRELSEQAAGAPEYDMIIDRIAVLTREAAQQRRNDDVTVTVTLEVAEALCTAAEMTVVPNPAGPGTAWTNDDGDVFTTTDEALVKALPRIAEIGTFWRADNEEMAEAALELRAGQSLGENEPQQRPHDSDSENGPNAGDAEQDYLDHVQKMEERASARPAVGARVLFIDQLDRYPHFTVPAGATGIVTQSDLDVYTVKVDQMIPGAEEWDNEVVWQVSDDEEPATDLRLAGAFVKHEVIQEMSYDDLGKAIAEGGPSELIDALLAERSERQRKADSIYSDEWDADGTISVHLPAGPGVNWAGWLETRGWMHRHGKWFSPADEASVWNIDEALQRQLLAEALR